MLLKPWGAGGKTAGSNEKLSREQVHAEETCLPPSPAHSRCGGTPTPLQPGAAGSCSQRQEWQCKGPSS